MDWFYLLIYAFLFATLMVVTRISHSTNKASLRLIQRQHEYIMQLHLEALHAETKIALLRQGGSIK